MQAHRRRIDVVGDLYLVCGYYAVYGDDANGEFCVDVYDSDDMVNCVYTESNVCMVGLKSPAAPMLLKMWLDGKFGQ